MIKISKHHENARLFLRLPVDDSQPILWRLASTEDSKHGLLRAGETDAELTSLLTCSPTWVLVPASEIIFHQVTLPHRSRRQRLQMLPFILEEQLSTDIENLHFAILQQHGDICDVAVVEKSVMQNWLAHCEQLGVREQMFLPDVLMLPLVREGWSAVSMNNQWFFRRDIYAGMVVESSWLPQLLAISPPTVIECYSTPPTQRMGIEWKTQPERDLLQLMAERGEYRGADLRQGEFSRKNTILTRAGSWRSVMFSLMAFLVLLCIDAGLTHYRLWHQANYWQQMSMSIYHEVFPGEGNVINPRIQMMKHLQQIPAYNKPETGTVVRQLQELLKETSTIRVRAMAWDSRRKEFKLDIQGTSFQALEQFQQLAGKKYHLQPGEIRQSSEGVESRIILGVRDE